MQFFYCVYQRTQVLARKRIKKRTKTGSKRSPPAKRMRMDTKTPATANNGAGSPWKSPGRETAESAEMSRLTSARPEPASRQQEANKPIPLNQPTTKLKISLSRGSVEDGSAGKGGKKSPVTASISRSSSSSSLAQTTAAKAEAKPKYTTSASTKAASQPSKHPAAKSTVSFAQTTPTPSPASSLSNLSNRKVSSATTSSKTPSPKPASVTNPMAKPVQTSVPNISATSKPSASQTTQAAKPTSVSKASVTKSVAAPVKSAPAAAPKLTGILKNSGSNSPLQQGILKNGNNTPIATVKTATAVANPKPAVSKVSTNSSVTTTAYTTVTTPAKPIPTPTNKSVTISNNVTVSTAKNSVTTASKPVTPTVSKPVTAVYNTVTPPAPNNTMKVQDSNKTPTTRPTPPLKPILKHPTPEQKKQLEQPLPKMSMITPASKGEKPSFPSPSMPKSILKTSTESKTNSLKPTSKKKEVVEISVEVSASDVKKVLEKKKAEKDHMRLGLANSTPVSSSGVEEKLYSNYSIVDQIKKAGSSALARHQTEQRAASMMDFTRGGDALSSVPKVPPTIQGLQPTPKPSVPPVATCHTNTSATESTALSTIVQNLANKQQKQMQENGSAGKDNLPTGGTPSNNNNNGSKVEGKTLATMLSCKGDAALTNQLPVNTSIRALNKDGSSVNSFEATNKQNFNFYKSNMTDNSKPMGGSGSLSDAVKNAESLAKNIPAGTTVTVKTVDNNKMSGKTSPAVSTSPKPRSPKTTMNNKVSLSVSNNATLARPTMSIVNPFTNASNLVASSPQSQPAMLMSQFHNSLGAMALHHNLLNFNNPVAALAAAQMDAAMRAVAAQQAVASSLPSSVVSSLANPVTTLNFTNPTLSSSVSVADDMSARFGLKIPTPPSRTSSPAVSGFGTSRLQVKVNSDSPRNSGSPNNISAEKSDIPNSVSNVKAIHNMPAILPFPTVKKAQVIPKSMNQQNRRSPTSHPSSPLTSLNSSQPMSTLPSSMGMFRSVTPAQMAQVNSLKKLAADLNTVHQKTLKGDNNILNPLKKPSDGKKLGLDAGVNNKEGVTSS